MTTAEIQAIATSLTTAGFITAADVLSDLLEENTTASIELAGWLASTFESAFINPVSYESVHTVTELQSFVTTLAVAGYDTEAIALNALIIQDTTASLAAASILTTSFVDEYGI